MPGSRIFSECLAAIALAKVCKPHTPNVLKRRRNYKKVIRQQHDNEEIDEKTENNNNKVTIFQIA